MTAPKLQRETNPLPPGRYWIDVADFPAGQIADFQKWASESGSLVTIETTEEHPRDEAGGIPPRAFFIFRVSPPGAFFDPKQFGFPTIADAGVKSEDDTAQVPDDDATGPSALKVALVVGGVALVLGAVVYFTTKRAAPTVVLQGPGPG